jgi:hypothetical protein
MRTSVANSLVEIARGVKAVGTLGLNWYRIETTARRYVAGKVNASRYRNEADMPKPRPT